MFQIKIMFIKKDTKTPLKFTFMHEQLYSDKQGNRDKMERERGVN